MDKKIFDIIMEDMKLDDITIPDYIRKVDEKISILNSVKVSLEDLKQKKWEKFADIIKKDFEGYEFYNNIIDNIMGIYVPVNEKINLRCFLSYVPYPHYGIRKEGDDSISPEEIENFLDKYPELVINKCSQDYFWNYVEEECSREDVYSKFKEYCKKLISYIKKK